MGVGGAVARLTELRQRQRRAQLETLRFLLLRDGDSGEEGFLGRRRVGRVAFRQNLAADAMQESVALVFSRLAREHQCLVDPA